MGTDTKALADSLAEIEDHLDSPEHARWRMVLRVAGEALRNGGAAPSVEERLTRYRCASRAMVPLGPYARGPEWAARVEDDAHDMLAAERPASPPPNEEAPLYNKGHQHGHVTGARAVLKRFDEWVKVIDFGLPLTAEDMREWSAAMRREMGLGEG